MRALLRGGPATWLLVALNLGLFAWMTAVDNRFDYALGQTAYLTQWGANVRGLSFTGEPWRLASSMFLHAGFMHLAFNMLALLEIGAAVERRLGSGRMLVLYLLAGLAGSLASAGWHDVVAVGASGAIFGLLAVVVVFGFFSREGLHTADGRPLSPWRALVVGAVAIGLGLFLPLDNAAHLGGFAGGLLLALAALAAERSGRRASPVVFGLAALALAGGLAGATWQAQDAEALARVRMAQLQNTLRAANADTRVYLRHCALTLSNTPARAAQEFAACLRTAGERGFASADLPAELARVAEHNLNTHWPRCRRQADFLLRHLDDAPRRTVVTTIGQHCAARQQLEAHLQPAPDAAPLPDDWRSHLLRYEILFDLSPDGSAGGRREWGRPRLQLDRRSLPPDLLAQAATLAAWQAGITPDDRELARLDTCPFYSCRRAWARGLGSGFLLP